MDDEGQMFDVIIIGAGLSGLLAAQILLKQEMKALVIESSSNCGGMISTYTIGQIVNEFNLNMPNIDDIAQVSKTYIEMGASEILSTHTYMRKLIEQYEIGFFPSYNDGKFLYFQRPGKIAKVGSSLDIYRSEEHQKTILRLIAKIENISKNIKQAHDNMINNHSKNYYKGVLSEYVQFFDQITVKQFFETQVENQTLRKMIINQFQTVQSISADKISILQVFLHDYGMENLRKLIEEKLILQENFRVKDGMRQLICKLEEKINKRGKKLGIRQPIRKKEPVLEIKNQINSEVVLITEKQKYKCFKVFFTASLCRASSIKIFKLSSAKRTIFQNQQTQEVQKLFLVFENAFWRAKFSGNGVFSEEYPFSQISDVSPSNLCCGILCFTLCGKKPKQWNEKFAKIANEEEKYKAMEAYLKQLIAQAFLGGNKDHESLKNMLLIPASLKENSGYQTYTKKGVCLKLDQASEDYLECYSRDEHNIVFLGSELSKKFGSWMEGAVRFTREKIYKYLEMEDPWIINT